MIMAFTACQLMLRPALDSRWTAGICLNPHTAQGAKYCCQVQGSISQEKNTACSEHGISGTGIPNKFTLIRPKNAE